MADIFHPLKSLDLKSILVATDLTADADKALEHGIAIARHYRATLYVVHIISSLGFTMAGPEAVDLAAEASKRDIDDLVNRLLVSGKLHGIEVQPVILKGNIDEQMESFAHAHRVDLIVVGTHGRQGMARFFFGSIAQLISICCCCPVLTVGPHSRGPWLDNPADLGKPLLFATAFNKASANALPYAVSLANDFERPLYALHVISPQRKHLQGHGHMTQNENEASALERLNVLVPLGADHKPMADFFIDTREPTDGILRAAKRLQAVTIIMGAHRDSFSELVIRTPRSITNDVNREALCPVLTVRG